MIVQNLSSKRCSRLACPDRRVNVSPPASKAPSLREAQRAVTRDRLRQGARAVFSERPYTEATIDEIALRSGVARATFYLHYDSKRTLLRDLLVEDMTAHRRLYHRLADLGAEPALADLERWIRRYMKAFSDRRAALSLFNLVIGSDPDFLTEITRERDALFDDVGARHAAFRFGADRVGRGRRMAAHLLVFKIEQFCLHAAFVDWEADLDAGVAILAQDLATFVRS